VRRGSEFRAEDATILFGQENSICIDHQPFNKNEPAFRDAGVYRESWVCSGNIQKSAKSSLL